MGLQARLWDAKTGKILRTLPGHAGGIEAVYLDEINNFMLTGSYDTTVRLWNVATGHCDATFDGCHSSTIVCLDADFASGFVVSGSKDKTVNVWQLDHAVKTAPLRRQGGPAYLYGAIRRLTMSPMSPPPPTMSPTSQTPGGGGSLSPSAAATPPSNTSPPLIRSGGGGGGGLFSPPPLTDTQMRESGAFAERARCLKTLQHTSEVLCVKLWSEGARGHARLATGTANGVLSYYDLGNGLCMKCINSAHRGSVGHASETLSKWGFLLILRASVTHVLSLLGARMGAALRRTGSPLSGSCGPSSTRGKANEIGSTAIHKN